MLSPLKTFASQFAVQSPARPAGSATKSQKGDYLWIAFVGTGLQDLRLSAGLGCIRQAPDCRHDFNLVCCTVHQPIIPTFSINQ